MSAVTAERGPVDVKIGVRESTKGKYDDFSTRWRLPLVEVADIAIDALNALSREQLIDLIERRPTKANRKVG